MNRSKWSAVVAMLAIIGAANADVNVPLASEHGPSGHATVSAGVGQGGLSGVGVSGSSGNVSGGVSVGTNDSVGVSGGVSSGGATFGGGVTRGSDSSTSVNGSLKFEY